MSEEKKLTFKKVGGGSFKLDKRTTILPGQIFEAYYSQIPVAFRDTVVVVETTIPKLTNEEKKKREQEQAQGKKEPYMKARGNGKLWWDVFNGNDEIVSPRALRKEDAEKMVELMKLNQ